MVDLGFTGQIHRFAVRDFINRELEPNPIGGDPPLQGELCRGINAVIKSRWDSHLDMSSLARRAVVNRHRQLDCKEWVSLVRYGRRESIEAAYSAFKGAFVEWCLARI